MHIAEGNGGVPAARPVFREVRTKSKLATYQCFLRFLEPKKNRSFGGEFQKELKMFSE